jgi:PKD repeat protein
VTAPASVLANEGQNFCITINSSDPDGDPITSCTVSGAPPGSTFTLVPGGGSTFCWTPSFSAAGTYSVTFTCCNALCGSATTVITVNDVNRQPVITAPATASGMEGNPIATITATATDADATNFLTITQAGKPASLTFTAQAPGPSPRTATITGTPAFGSGGTYSIVWTVNDGVGGTASTTTVFTVCQFCGLHQPAISAPATASGVENIPIATITATATDADAADVLTITQAGMPAVLTFTTNAPGVSPRTAQITGTPSFGSAGIYSIVWRVNDGGVFNATASTTTILTITRGTNRCPVSNPARGFPYSAIVGVPLTFDGTASFDPDGDPLTYAWDFDASDGITVDATGPMPVHTYPAAGTFTVTLTVTDNGNGDPAQICSNSAGTIATIAPACPATIFNGYDVIKLATGRPTWFAFVQPAGGCYTNTDVVFSSFVLKYAGNQISADARKTFVGGDRSGDGIEEIRVTFLKADLRTLFAALPNGHNVVEVTIEANLATGGILHGTTQVDVVNSGSSSTAAATISPNPMNPAATLTFTTTRSGSAKVEMFDIRGRLVRTILDERWLSAGVHDVRIEGRGRRGESLASGIYFIRGVSPDGGFKQTIAILK